MRRTALAFLAAGLLASFAHAVPLYDGFSQPASGKVTRYLSGKDCIAASSTTAGTCVISADGSTGIVVAPNFTGRASLATTADALTTAPSACTAPNFSRGIGANGNAICQQPTDVTGTAAALATTPTRCLPGQSPTGVDAQGNAVSCTTIAQIIVSSVTTVTGNITGTNTSFAGCLPTVSTLTVTSVGGPISLWYSGPVRSYAASNAVKLFILQDGAFFDGETSTIGFSISSGTAAAKDGTIYHRTIANPVAGTHSYCLGMVVSAGTGALDCDQAACQFGLSELQSAGGGSSGGGGGGGGPADPLDPVYAPTVDTDHSHYYANVWMTDSMTKVRSDSGNPGVTNWFQGVCMRNEICSFQVHLQAPASGGWANLKVTTSDLIEPRNNYHITANTRDYQVHREMYVIVGTMTNTAATTYYGSLGNYPDALVPVTDPYWGQTTNANTWSIPSSSGAVNQSFWIDVHIPTAAPSGYYTSSVYVSSPTGVAGSIISTMTVAIAVGDWVMPSTATLQTLIPLGYAGLCIQQYGGPTNVGCQAYTNAAFNDDGASLVALDAFTFGLDHRVSILGPYPPLDASFASFNSRWRPAILGTQTRTPQILPGAAANSFVWSPQSISSTSASNWMRDATGIGLGTPVTITFACTVDNSGVCKATGIATKPHLTINTPIADKTVITIQNLDGALAACLNGSTFFANVPGGGTSAIIEPTLYPGAADPNCTTPSAGYVPGAGTITPPGTTGIAWRPVSTDAGTGSLLMPPGYLQDYTCDENVCTSSTFISRAQTRLRASPPMGTLWTTDMTATLNSNTTNYLTVFVPIINNLDVQGGTLHRSDYTAWLSATPSNCGETAAGAIGGNLLCPRRQLWSYQSCSSSGTCANKNIGGTPGGALFSWPNYNIDGKPVANRAMEWMTYFHQQTGELYYDANFCWTSGFGNCGLGVTNNVWTNPNTFYYSGGNGDGTLIWPGTTQAIGVSTPTYLSSIRLNEMRSGMQDYEYMYALNALGQSSLVTNALSTWITNTYTFNVDPYANGSFTGTILSARKTMFTALHQIAHPGSAGSAYTQ